MANINVSFSDIEQAAKQLSVGREEITSRLQSMQQLIGNLVSSGFVTDQASVKFSGSYTEYTAGAQTVIAKLTEIEQFLVHTATSMREMDQSIAARIS